MVIFLIRCMVCHDFMKNFDYSNPVQLTIDKFRIVERAS